MQIIKTIIAISLIATMAMADRFSRDKEIVMDSETGLQWQDDSEAKTIVENWQGAIDYCESSTLGGYTDWRLPNIRELKSIVDRRRYNPAIYSIFENVDTTRYYNSSTSDVSFSSGVWSVYFKDGSADTFSYHHKNKGSFIRCVR